MLGAVTDVLSVTELVPAAAGSVVPAPLALVDRAPLTPTVPVTAQTLSALKDLLAGYLASLRSPRTRTAYRGDLVSWLSWCAGAGVDVLAAGIHHADVYLRVLAEHGDPTTGRTLAASSIGRRSSAIHGFYRYATRHGAVTGSPFTGINRPTVEEESMTSGLTREEVRALLAAARAASPRAEALVTLLVLNGLRITEALAARIEDFDTDRGHTVLRIRRKGGKRAKAPLTPATTRALDAVVAGRQAGPIFATATGRALDRSEAWRLLRRLAADAGIPGAARISPHCLRHTYATIALDAGVPLRDLQDSMGHADPRTTRMYDRTRGNLDRNATYAVTAALADH